jgi:hypothetical protein
MVSNWLHSFNCFMHVARTTEAWLRLVVGIVLNVALWPFTAGLARWGNYGRESRFLLLSIAAAVTALVTVIPLFWRGKPWQAPIAFILLWLPLLALYGSVCRICNF